MIAVVTWLLSIGVALPMLVLALECFAGSLARRERPGAGDAPPFVVLMPAHDEARGIARSVRSVITQLRACDQLVVIADNCTDDTAGIARRMGAAVFERHDPERRGKGYALEFGRRFIAANPAQIVIVLDADCTPAPYALRHLAATAAKRHAVAQGAYLLVPPPGAPAIVRVSCFAFLVKNLVRQLGLRRLAGVALLQGSGMAFPYSIFRRIEWNAASLVEDLDLGLRLLCAGEAVVFDDGARFYSEASSLQGTGSQRRRWEHGMLQCMLDFAPRLALAAFHGRPHLLFVAFTLLVPPTVLLLAIATAATALVLLLSGLSAPLLVLLASWLAMGTGLFAAWSIYGRATLPARSLRDVFGYAIWKLPILLQFVTRRERQWVRTEREP